MKQHLETEKQAVCLSEMLSGIGVMFAFFLCASANATPVFSIDWAGTGWNIEQSTDSTGTAGSSASVDTSTAGGSGPVSQVPTSSAYTQASGGNATGSSANAQVRITRDFQIVRNESSDSVPIQLVGKADYSYDRRQQDFVNVIADAKVYDEATQTDAMAFRRQWLFDSRYDHAESGSANIYELGNLQLGENYVVKGDIHARANSNINSDWNMATGTLALTNPIQFTTKLDNQYYDLLWNEDWQPSTIGYNPPSSGQLELEQAIADVAGDYVAGLIDLPFLGNYIGDQLTNAILILFGGKVHEEAAFVDGLSYVYARANLTGDASVNQVAERSFQIVPDYNAPVKLGFDGFLDGSLFSTDHTSSALNLASVSVSGTGLDWNYDSAVMGGDVVDINSLIEAVGTAKANTTYTFEAVLDTSSLADPLAVLGEQSFADFASTFGGSLYVDMIPEPATFLLTISGLAGMLGYRRYGWCRGMVK